MFPVRDENPQLQTPYVTYALIVINVLAWFLVQDFGSEKGLMRSICDFGLIASNVTGVAGELGGQEVMCAVGQQANWFSIISSMFMHGSWMHIAGNMWFLWIFGDNVEDSMGPARFLVFYILCGFVAAALQVFQIWDRLFRWLEHLGQLVV